MGLPVTVYRYTDEGAPQLVNSTPSEWINILKKVLVEGYGDKAPLGWTIEFENIGTYKIVFRNSLSAGGTGGYFQFSSGTGANTTAAHCRIKTALSMTGIDVFIKAAGARMLQLSSSAKGWEIIGTSRGFYLIQHRTTLTVMQTGSVSYQSCFFIGDLASFYGNDQSIFTTASGDSSSGDTSSMPASSTIGWSTTNHADIYALDGSNFKQLHTMTMAFTMTTSTAFILDAEAANIQHIMVTPVFAIGYNTADANGTLGNDSTMMPNYRAYMPGYVISSFMGYINNNWPVDREMNGVRHTLLRGALANRMWINTEVWYD